MPPSSNAVDMPPRLRRFCVLDAVTAGEGWLHVQRCVPIAQVEKDFETFLAPAIS